MDTGQGGTGIDSCHHWLLNSFSCYPKVNFDMANSAFENWFCFHHHKTTLQKGPAIHQSEECAEMSFAVSLSLHEVPSGSISFKINFSTFLKKWNKAQTCVIFWVSFGFVLHYLWDVSPKTQPFNEDFVRTEVVIKTVFKEKIMKISMKTVYYLRIWAELHIAALTRKQGIQLSVPWH